MTLHGISGEGLGNDNAYPGLLMLAFIIIKFVTVETIAAS